MGFRIVTDEWIQEKEREMEFYREGFGRMTKEHDKALAWAREIRDTKDAEIERLHAEIEARKNERAETRKENKRRR